MKNYIIVALLAIGLLAGTTLSAQEYYELCAAKKDYKMHKKESKISDKMFRDRAGAAHRKRQKARKKAYKMEMKQYRYK